MATAMEHKVASGVAWSFMEKLLTMVIQMAVSIIVARALMPEDFGVMAILTFFTSVALTIVDSGFSQTLIRKASVTDGDYRSVLRFNVVMSLLLYVVLTALARPIASMYDAEAIATVAPVLFLVLPINALCVVQTVMFTREFRFALLSKIVFFSSLISGAVVVAMALLGCGIWSLVAQRLLMMGIKAAVFWYIRRWRSAERASMASLRSMAPFSLRLLATDLIASMYNNVAQLFIGKMYSTASLGYYSQAQKLKDLPVTSSVQAVQGVTYPALSAMAGDGERLSQGYLRIVRMLSFVLFPAMLGLVAVAPDMFRLLLGERWMPTVPYFEILALSGLCYPIAMVSYNILKTKSDGRVILWLEVVKRVIMTLILTYTIPRGVETVAWGMTAMALVEFLLNTAVAMRYLTIKVGAIVGAIVPHLLLASAMFMLLRYLNTELAALHEALRLLVAVGVGGATYLAAAWLLRLKALNEGVELLRGMLARGIK
ncbi:MAG: lipopolysaccharide biosynthesis protein [Alistipes sp.]|nr:lipopolysaccharide biosynthesis protein [Alistipes sp.]